MQTWMWVVVALVVVLALFGKAKQAALPSGTWPFYAKKLLTSPEQVLYWRLVKALPDDAVFAQVQLSRILGVKKGHKFNEWNNRVNRLSADFVVCAKDAKVLAVIELDDATHVKPDRVATDARKDKALTDAGIRVIRWKVSAMPDEAAILAAVHSMPLATGGTEQ